MCIHAQFSVHSNKNTYHEIPDELDGALFHLKLNFYVLKQNISFEGGLGRLFKLIGDI
jgi:hypothetical protein